MRRAVIATAVLVPIGTAFFALLMFVATRIAGVPEGGPVAMGAATGVLAGLFFGTWAGVVVSARDIERTELEADAEGHRDPDGRPPA